MVLGREWVRFSKRMVVFGMALGRGWVVFYREWIKVETGRCRDEGGRARVMHKTYYGGECWGFKIVNECDGTGGKVELTVEVLNVEVERRN